MPTTRPAAHRAARLASRLAEAHRVVDEALADAAISVDQATVIVHAVDDLPAEVEDSVREQAEAFLLREAADHDAQALRILGRRLLEVIDPAAAEAEEAAAQAAASFTMSDHGQGSATAGSPSLPSTGRCPARPC